MPQPNVPGRGIVASYGARFWMLVVLIGLGAGLGGAALIELLRAVQHVAWSYHSGDFLDAVKRTSATRRVLVLLVGGVVAGAGTMLLARTARARSRKRCGCAARACRSGRASRGRSTRS